MGALVAHDAWRRRHFPSGTGGAGMVEIKDRRLSYFAPLGARGGSVSIDTLQRAEIHRGMRDQITWVFYDDDGILEVPGNAAGAEDIFDALVVLPGVNYDQAIAATTGQGPDVFLVWRRGKAI